MTREEAIKVLQREKDCVQQAIQSATECGGYVSPDGQIRADDYVDACAVAISALRAQQTIHVTDLYDEDGGDVYRVRKDCIYPKWISVKDRLPKNEKAVLTFVGYENSMIGFMTVSSYFCYDTTPHWQWDGLMKDEQKTLFWMPLPEPPEEDDHGN